jgi:hypothetical protein
VTVSCRKIWEEGDKPEIRNPKAEDRRKAEIRNPKKDPLQKPASTLFLREGEIVAHLPAWRSRTAKGRSFRLAILFACVSHGFASNPPVSNCAPSNASLVQHLIIAAANPDLV